MKTPFTLETAFGSYTLTELLGEGGSGQVYGGTDAVGAPIAANILSADRMTTEKRRRFKNEIAFLLRTSHPNIVGVVDHGVLKEKSANRPFYLMARYQSTLRQAMRAGSLRNRRLACFMASSMELKRLISKALSTAT